MPRRGLTQTLGPTPPLPALFTRDGAAHTGEGSAIQNKCETVGARWSVRCRSILRDMAKQSRGVLQLRGCITRISPSGMHMRAARRTSHRERGRLALVHALTIPGRVPGAVSPCGQGVAITRWLGEIVAFLALILARPGSGTAEAEVRDAPLPSDNGEGQERTPASLADTSS
jgi:hypothetical protein